MLHPSYTDLMAVVNSDVEPGEQPVVQSRYSIVLAVSKRARQIIAERGPVTNGTDGAKDEAKPYNYAQPKPLSIAVDELYNGKIKILGDDETQDEVK